MYGERREGQRKVTENLLRSAVPLYIASRTPHERECVREMAAAHMIGKGAHSRSLSRALSLSAANRFHKNRVDDDAPLFFRASETIGNMPSRSPQWGWERNVGWYEHAHTHQRPAVPFCRFLALTLSLRSLPRPFCPQRLAPSRKFT